MSYRLTNALATLQAYIDDYLQTYNDDIGMYYSDNLLIQLTHMKENEDHVWKVLRCVQEFDLHFKSKKCQFWVPEVDCVGFVINLDGIGIKSYLIFVIDHSPTPKWVRDIQVVHGLMIFFSGPAYTPFSLHCDGV